MTLGPATATPTPREIGERAAYAFRLPFSGRIWRGAKGHLQGAGAGSSIDFQDHRNYLPGDDPRHINWQAYARTGHYTMKLYREEVSPKLDLIVDCSASQFVDQEKKQGVLALFHFCRQSALEAGASLKCHWIDGDQVRSITPEEDEPEPPAADAAFVYGPQLNTIPWRGGSLRIVISDLLYPLDTGAHLSPLVQEKAHGLYFAVHCRAETRPDWEGNLTMVDCESGIQRRQQMTPSILKNYHEAYARHFENWEMETRRMGIPMARVDASLPLTEALQQDALQRGLVELCL
jgi:uncharacterized protein (DUF58 family)